MKCVRPIFATQGKGETLYPYRHLPDVWLSSLAFNRGLAAWANHTPDTHRKQLDHHSQVSRWWRLPHRVVVIRLP